MMLKVCMPQSRQRVLRQEPLQKASGIAKEQVENEGPIKGVAFADSQPRLLQSPNDVFSEKSPRPPPTAHGGSLAIQESAIAENKIWAPARRHDQVRPQQTMPQQKTSTRIGLSQNYTSHICAPSSKRWRHAPCKLYESSSTLCQNSATISPNIQ